MTVISTTATIFILRCTRFIIKYSLLCKICSIPYFMYFVTGFCLAILCMSCFLLFLQVVWFGILKWKCQIVSDREVLKVIIMYVLLIMYGDEFNRNRTFYYCRLMYHSEMHEFTFIFTLIISLHTVSTPLTTSQFFF